MPGLIASVESRADGSYVYGWLSFGGSVSAGDTFTFTLTDSEGNSQKIAPYTLTAADVSSPFTVALDLAPPAAGITVRSDSSALPADGTSTVTITAKVLDDNGDPVTGDTVTISADKGMVGAATDNGDGTYTATYTAPSPRLDRCGYRPNLRGINPTRRIGDDLHYAGHLFQRPLPLPLRRICSERTHRRPGP